MQDVKDTAQSIVSACARLADLGMANANGGNISVRLSESELLVTPTGESLRDVTVNDLVTVDMSGEKRHGKGEPSMETNSHIVYYRERPDVHAVIHCHPPFALAWALSGKLPPLESFCEGYFLVGKVQLVHPYRTPTDQPAVVKEQVQEANGFLLSNHGLIMAGPDLRLTQFRVETYELLCQAALEATRIGGASPIPDAQLAWLRGLHERHFPR